MQDRREGVRLREPTVRERHPMHRERPAIDRPVERTKGALEITNQGHGFLRDPAREYAPTPADAFVPRDLIQRLRLRGGTLIEGESQRDRHGRLQVRNLVTIEGLPHPEWIERPIFESLTSISPNQR